MRRMCARRHDRRYVKRIDARAAFANGCVGFSCGVLEAGMATTAVWVARALAARKRRSAPKSARHSVENIIAATMAPVTTPNAGLRIGRSAEREPPVGRPTPVPSASLWLPMSSFVAMFDNQLKTDETREY